MFQALEPFIKDIVVDEPSKDSVTAVKKFFSCYKKYQHKEPLKDLGVPCMTVEESWEDGDKDYTLFEYENLLVTKQANTKLLWIMRRLHKWYILHVYVACNLSKILFLKGSSRVKDLI
jgi:hypothetical protein